MCLIYVCVSRYIVICFKDCWCECDSMDVCIYKNMRTRSLDLPPLWSYLKSIVYFGAFKIFWMHQM